MESTKSGVSIPKWNGKQETFARYAAKVHALAVYYECGDAFEETAGTKLVTKTQYESISDKTTGIGKQQADLYIANKRMCALIVLGQDSDHGLATIQKTATKDHPHGNASPKTPHNIHNNTQKNWQQKFSDMFTQYTKSSSTTTPQHLNTTAPQHHCTTTPLHLHTSAACSGSFRWKCR